MTQIYRSRHERRPKLRVFYNGRNHLVQNLGDALTLYIIQGLGFDCVDIRATSPKVVNPGRCLLCIGSILTSELLRKFEIPLDVWGSGWKGMDLWQHFEAEMCFHAVRGPLTAKGMHLPQSIPLGDPALLLPLLFPRVIPKHNKTILIPHISRISYCKPAECARNAGCEEIETSLVYAAPTISSLRSLNAAGVLSDLWFSKSYRKAGIRKVWELVEIIAGASFVLTGSLHGAILAQAYGVPWAAYTDGFVDAPPKWRDWGAYLGTDVNFTRNLHEGQEWWSLVGRHGRINSLSPLLKAFPYLNASQRALDLLRNIDQMQLQPV